MLVYQHPTEARTFFAPDVKPSLDLAVPIQGIEGLNNYSLPHPSSVATPVGNAENATPNAGVGLAESDDNTNNASVQTNSIGTPVDNAGNLIAVGSSGSGYGSGPGGEYIGSDFRAAYVPGTALAGAKQLVGLLEFDGYSNSDITHYEVIAGLPSVPLTNVLLEGFNGQPSGLDIEPTLDIDMVIAMAPGLSGVIVYEAGLSRYNEQVNANYHHCPQSHG